MTDFSQFIQPTFSTEFILFIVVFFAMLLLLSYVMRAFFAMYATVLSIGVFFYVALLDDSFIIVYTMMLFTFILLLFAHLRNLSNT